VNEEFLKAVKDAGCHTIMFGIESANEEILKKYKKNTKQSQMIEALNTTRRLGLKSVGTFVIGLPGESEQSIKDTIEFATKLALDYASFNIATPRFGSTFRRLMREQGALDTTRMTFDSSQSKPAWLEEAEDSILPNEVIFRLQSMAIKRFYLRPGFLFRRVMTLKTPYQAWAHVREAFDLLRSR
jgi:radical SAM superfamily enzyme YgiQ (UPF0313 family)